MKEISDLLKNAELSEEDAENVTGGLIFRFPNPDKNSKPLGFITDIKTDTGTRNA